MAGAQMRWIGLTLLFASWIMPGLGQERDNASKVPSAAATSSAKTPSTADIAAAKAAHKVWVNLDSGVYHKGGRWYGKTKNGKFMTPDEAKKAGYKAAKRD
jgi:hypothetical protein